jgi:predicted GNAT family N-acyltransferase
MHARKNSIGFYEKMGYAIASDEFTEVTIPHYVMEKKL